MKQKFKYLFKNIGLLLVGNFASKILVFLLVPFYTSILSTYEYGIYDLYYATLQLLFPILSLNVVDAVMRFPIEAKKKEQKIAFTLGLKCICLASIIIFFSSIIFSQVIKPEVVTLYWKYFVILFIAYALNNIIIQFARGIDDVSGIAIAGVIGTCAMILFNILFLLVLKLSLVGYFYAMILSLIFPVLFLSLRDRLWEYIYINKAILKVSSFEKEMLAYCLPLMFINVSWYINNVADRYVVTWLCGVEANGVYSVAYKIPAILNAVQVVFIQAWQLSAVKEYEKEKGIAFYSKTYQGCQNVITLLCSCLILSTKVISGILFAKEFYQAWRYIPVLLIYIVFNTLSGTIGGIFTATKDTKKLAYSSIIGAITNILLNFVFVFFMGPIGAAIATVISSWLIWALRIKSLRNHIKLQIHYGLHSLQYAILFGQAAALILINNTLYMYIVQSCSIVLIGIISFFDVKKGFKIDIMEDMSK